MAFQLDKEWQLQPIKGATGQTYIGTRATEKVFIKLNTSPLLAALSKEGLTPKLVWTKQTVSGDSLSAQEWIDGRVLKADEVGIRNDVRDVLYQLHHSYSLKQMLEKIGGQTQTPAKLLQTYDAHLPKELQSNSYLTQVFSHLNLQQPTYNTSNYQVVHGDVNHRNWLAANNYLYLVDWDSVMIADPAVDLGMLLGHYVEKKQWNSWLLSYGLHPTKTTIQRVEWYAVLSFLQEISRYYKANEQKEMNREILKLKELLTM